MLSKHRVGGGGIKSKRYIHSYNTSSLFLVEKKKMKSIRIEMNRESGKCAHRKNNHGKSRQVPLFNPSGSFPVSLSLFLSLSLSLSLSASKLKINPVSHPSSLGAPPTSQAGRYICVLTLMYRNSFLVLFNAVLVRIPIAQKPRGVTLNASRVVKRGPTMIDDPRFVMQVERRRVMRRISPILLF